MFQAISAPQTRRSVIEHGPRLALVTFGVLLATLLELIDTTIVNVALPYIEGNLGASIEEGTFIVTGYIVANIVVLPMTPWLQRRFGRRQYYLSSIAIFTAASIMCGLSGSLEQLVFWRIIQGFGGGGLISTSQAILRETFPPEKAAMAQGIFGVGAIVGPSIGPVLGGVLTDNLSWQWVFFVNLPIGLAAFAIIWNTLRNPESPVKLPFDYVGVTLLAIGFGALQFVLDQGQEKDWFSSEAIAWTAAVSVVALAVFVWYELYGTSQPAVDLRILRNPTVTAGSLLGACLGVSLLGSLITLPAFVQGQLGFTATLAGETILFRALAIMALMPLGTFLSRKMNPVVQVAAGFTILGISNLWLAAITTTETSYWSFAGPLILSGAGLSQIFIPISVTVFGSVAMRDIPKASAMYNLMRQLGGSIATGILVTLIARQAAAHQTALSANVTLASPMVRAYAETRGGVDAPAVRAALGGLVVAQATTLAYADTARDVGLLTFAFIPLVLLLRRPIVVVEVEPVRQALAAPLAARPFPGSAPAPSESVLSG